MPSEQPRWHATIPPRKRRDGNGGFMTALLAVVFGLTLLAGPFIFGAWINGAFDAHEIFQ